MQLNDAIDTYLIVTKAEGFEPGQQSQTESLLVSFLDFTGNLPVGELDNLHIMLYLSEEWVEAKHSGRHGSLREFLSRYIHLFRFFRWMEVEGLVTLDFYDSWRKKLRPEDQPTGHPWSARKNPPQTGGFLFK